MFITICDNELKQKLSLNFLKKSQNACRTIANYITRVHITPCVKLYGDSKLWHCNFYWNTLYNINIDCPIITIAKNSVNRTEISLS